MIGIQRVGSLDNHTIDIEFTNTHVLLLDLKQLDDPLCRRMVENGTWIRPQSDGESIWWEDGPRFSIDDLVRILTNGKGE